MTKPSKWVERARRELLYYRALLQDPRTPRAARWLIATGIGYLLLPFDLIPDFIPVIGQLDDVIVLVVLLGIGLRLIPTSVKQDVRARSERAPDPIGHVDSDADLAVLFGAEAPLSDSDVHATSADWAAAAEARPESCNGIPRPPLDPPSDPPAEIHGPSIDR